MSDPEPFAAPNQPVATNRFGTPSGLPGASAADPSPAYPNPYANPYAAPGSAPWAGPSTLLPATVGPVGRSRPTWLLPVAGLVAVVLLVIGGVTVAALQT